MLSNVYLNEVDKMLEKAIVTTQRGGYTQMQYARFADDLVILISSHRKQDWVVRAVEKRLREELAKLRVEINEEKTRMVNLSKGESFGFLGFEFRLVRSRKGNGRTHFVPKMKKRTALLRKLKAIFQMALRQARYLQWLPGELAKSLTSSGGTGPITPDRKQAGKPSAGKQPAGFDEAGAGTQLTVWTLRHSQRKRRDPARLNLRSMAPVLDPTTETTRHGASRVRSTEKRAHEGG